LRSLALAIVVCDFRIANDLNPIPSSQVGIALNCDLFTYVGLVTISLARAPTKEKALLTESTVEQMFRKLMNDQERDEQSFEMAEELIDVELRPESTASIRDFQNDYN
jgi:hypothetical protein